MNMQRVVELQKITLVSFDVPMNNFMFWKVNVISNRVDRWGRSSKIVISIRTFLKDRNKAEHE
jgi:hypothetical protein